MVTDFYLLHRCASPQLQMYELLIYVHAQSEYGYELVGDYHNTVFKPDLIQIYQESARTTGFLEQYIQHLDLCHLNQRAYQLPTIFFYWN